jgi:CRP/FNR family cyclic AMP-dependent transcriptional regulator
VTFHLRKTEKTDQLESLDLFRDLSRRERAQIADVLVEEEVPTGRPLTREGQDGGTAYVIVDGTAEVTRGDTTLATLGPGDVVGELSLLDHQPRSATVTATSDLKVLAITHTDLAKILCAVPDLAFGLLSVLARRVRELDSKVVTS